MDLDESETHRKTTVDHKRFLLVQVILLLRCFVFPLQVAFVAAAHL